MVEIKDGLSTGCDISNISDVYGDVVANITLECMPLKASPVSI